MTTDTTTGRATDTAPGRAQTASASDRGLDPSDVADRFTTATLLRCWLREGGPYRREDTDLVLDLSASGARITAPIDYWSRSGWHTFGPARLDPGTPADSTTVAALLSCELAAGRRAYSSAIADLVARVVDSRARIARHVTADNALPGPPAPRGSPFLEAEQALALGHPLHPAPKSRPGLSETEADTYSPELHGSFPLHWFAARRDVLRSDSADGRPAEDLMCELSDGLQVPQGFVPLPAHPWQAGELLRRRSVKTLIDDGDLISLGSWGPDWSPTSSVRTVHRLDAGYMLKLSLGLSITNSKRENLHKELLRGSEMARMLDRGLSDVIAAAHPGFSIVRDPAWLAVPSPDGSESGLEVVVRDNPFGSHDRVQCLAGLVAERPVSGGCSLLASLVHTIAVATGRGVEEVSREWFRRYLDAVPAAVLWLYAAHGIGLEAHQQNTLVELDPEGWPVGGRYRDNQGYYYDRTRVAALGRWVAEPGLGSDSRCDPELIDERLGYYLGLNNVIGLVGAMGSQGLADERDLLAEVRVLLRRAASDHRPTAPLVRALLHAESLPCKANLLTRFEGMDELVGPLATQSVYRPVANPIPEFA